MFFQNYVTPESKSSYFSGISAISNEGKFSLEQAFNLLFFAKCYKFFLVLGYLHKKASGKTFIFANGDLVAHCVGVGVGGGVGVHTMTVHRQKTIPIFSDFFIQICKKALVGANFVASYLSNHANLRLSPFWQIDNQGYIRS